MEYCIAAANSPFAPPNCSSSMFPNRGSGWSTRTVYISFFTWWYMHSPIHEKRDGSLECSDEARQSTQPRLNLTRNHIPFAASLAQHIASTVAGEVTFQLRG